MERPKNKIKKSTLYITAPEVLKGKPVSFASDWWSFGCLLYECFTGEQPFNGFSSYQLEQSILSGQPGVCLKEFPELNDLISKLLCKSPRFRLKTASEIKTH